MLTRPSILTSANTQNTKTYFGSPAQAMMMLSDKTEYFFHDIEQMPLDDIRNFSISVGLRNKVNTICGDSISAFLDGRYRFTSDDLVFIDPYQPFDGNASGQNFFDVFIQAYKSQGKTVLWYGYDSLKSKDAIIIRLRKISEEYAFGKIYTFDIWQSCMGYESCAINPGVPGCGLAIAYLSEESVVKIRGLLHCIEDVYKNVLYNGTITSISTERLMV